MRVLSTTWRQYSWPCYMWLTNRILIVLVVWVSFSQFTVCSDPEYWSAFPEKNVTNGFLRWDAEWYADIAANGYINPAEITPDAPRNTAFFPLYPLLTKGVSSLVGNTFLAGLIVSNLAFLVALLLLYDLVLQTHDKKTARRTTTLLLFHPCSFFFSAMYTESLFLLWAVSAFLAARHQKWLAAGVFAALCGATRVVGFLVIIGLAVTYLERIQFSFKRIRTDSLWIMVGVLGPLAHMTFLYLTYQNPFEFIAGQHHWASEMSIIPVRHMDFFNYGFLGVCLVMVLLTWKSESKAFIIWSTLMVMASATRWSSMSRLSLVIFPFYIVAAQQLRNTKYFWTLVIISCSLLIFLTGRFALWHWVA